jgi:DNA-binding LacI/PurR family transcriptional regulator
LEERLSEHKSNRIGVVLHSGDYAPALYAAAKTLGLSIPGDLAVIAFHYQLTHSELIPSLSSLELDTDQLYDVIIDSVNALVEGQSLKGPVRIPYALVNRESTFQ